MRTSAAGGIPSSDDPLVSSKRLASLAATRLMDTKPEEAFDRLTRLAAKVIRVPIAAVTLLDATRQFIKSGVGLDLANPAVQVCPVGESFCQHAVRSGQPFVVEDARAHPLVKHSRAVADGLVSYAAIPIMSGGEPLGAFCVADDRPRAWTEKELAVLRDLAAAVENQIAAHVLALEAERRREVLEAVIDTMGAGVLVCDSARQIRVTNAEARRMLAQPLAGPISERAQRLGLYHADGKTLFKSDELPLFRAAGGDRIDDLEMVVRPPHMPGHVTFVTVNARPLPTGGAVMIIHDQTTTRELERRAQRNEAIYRKLAGNIPNALVYLLDRSLKILLAEGRLFAKLPIEPASLVGKPLLDFVSPENRPQTEAGLRAALAGKSGQWMSHRGDESYAAHVEPVYEGSDIAGAILFYFDVTERERSQRKIEEMSIRDELTGLYNRRGFLARGQRCLDTAANTGKAPILFFVDLNGMKPINDQMGHEEGDRALVDTARLLDNAFGTADLVARLGGDEFVVLVADPEGKPPSAYEKEVRDAITKFNDACSRVYRLSVSIGATEFDPAAPRTLEQLLTAADAQMYAAKRARQARGGVSIPPSRA